MKIFSSLSNLPNFLPFCGFEKLKDPKMWHFLWDCLKQPKFLLSLCFGFFVIFLEFYFIVKDNYLMSIGLCAITGFCAYYPKIKIFFCNYKRKLKC